MRTPSPLPSTGTKPLPATKGKPHRGKITDAQMMSAPNGDVGLFVMIEVTRPRAYARTPLVHMIPIYTEGKPLSVVAGGLELIKLGLTQQEAMTGDVPALLRGRHVEFNYKPANGQAGTPEEIHILRVLGLAH